VYLAIGSAIVAVIGFRAKAFLPLFNGPQQVIEQRAEIGLDDVKFGLGDRHNLVKIVDDLHAVGWTWSMLGGVVLGRYSAGNDTPVVRIYPRCRAELPPH
jgi:hypothetical protein